MNKMYYYLSCYVVISAQIMQRNINMKQRRTMTQIHPVQQLPALFKTNT